MEITEEMIESIIDDTWIELAKADNQYLCSNLLGTFRVFSEGKLIFHGNKLRDAVLVYNINLNEG